MATVQKRQILLNASAAVAQVVISALILFVLYRYLLRALGVQRMGTWSVVLAATSATRIGDLGFSGGVVKFVAKYIARAQPDDVAAVIETAVISIAVLIGAILIPAFFLLKAVLAYFIPSAGLSDAHALLPFAIISFWINSVAAVVQSGLEGHQRIDLNSLLMTFSNVVYLLLTFALVSTYGLMGLAYCQMVQSLVLILAAWALLRKEAKRLPLVPVHWSRKLFLEMLHYGINFQITSVATILFDPITKAWLSRFGGLAMTGYYEMASRMITQIRSILVAANKVVVPVIANFHENTPGRIGGIYGKSYSVMSFFAIPAFSSIVAATPFISEIWIGHYERIFVVSSYLLAASWFVNTLCAPAYFSNLGTGHLRWNTIGHTVIGITNAGLGYLLGTFFGGMGVLTAVAISLTLGSLIIIAAYHQNNELPLNLLFPRPHRFLFAVGAIGLLFVLSINSFNYRTATSRTIPNLILLLYLMALIISVWLHPLRKQLMSLAKK